MGTKTRKDRLTTEALQPSVRIGTSWSPAAIRSAMTTADGGRISRAAELCDLVMADDRVQQALETVVGGVLGLDLEFEAGKGRRAAEAATALEDDWYLAFPEPTLTRLVAWGIMLGVSFGQIVWQEENGRLLPTLRFYHPRHATWDWQTRKWQLQTQNRGIITIEPDDDSWIVFCPYGESRPWAQGKWRGLAEWWLIKDYARMDWARVGEGSATRIAKLDTNKSGGVPSSPDQRKDLANQIDRLGAEGVIVLPPGWDMDLLQAAASTWSIYSNQIDMANNAIDINLKGQNLTTQVEGGSRAAAEVHERVESRVIRSVARRTEITIREHALKPWAMFNFGAEDAAPWPRYHTEEDENVNECADRFDKVAGALEKLKRSGHKADPAELEERFGFKIQVDPNADKADGDGAGGGKDQKQGGTDDTRSKASAGFDGAHGARAGLPVQGLRADSGRNDDGPDYTNRLTDEGGAAAASELSGFVGNLLSLIEEEARADDGADQATRLRRLRQRVLDEYAAEPPGVLVELVANTMVLARLAGMHAVRTEDGGLDPEGA